MRRWAIGLLVGCGPGTVVGPAELDELCGRDGPVQLLAIDEDEELSADLGDVARVGDRLYVEPPGDDDAVVSVGLCGESPTTVATEVVRVRERSRYAGVPLGCTTSRSEIVRLDPHGADAPRVVFTAGACDGTWVEGQIIAADVRGQEPAVVLAWDLPADLEGPPVEPRVLLEGIRGTINPKIEAFDDEVLVANLQDQMVRIALPTGEADVEVQRAAAFDVSPDQRYLAFVTSYEPVEDGFIRGELVVRNRETGQETVLPEAVLAMSGTFDIEGFVRVWLNGGSRPAARILDLESLVLHAVPDELVVWNRAGDGRWLLSDHARNNWWLRDLDSGEMVELPITGRPNLSHTWTFDREGFELIDAYGFVGPLRRVRYADATDRLLADEVTYGFQRVAGSIVTLRDAADGRDLFVIDPRTHDARVLFFGASKRPLQAGSALGLGDRDVVFGGRDGDLSGIWRARLVASDGISDRAESGGG